MEKGAEVISTLKLMYATLVVMATVMGFIISGAGLLQVFTGDDTLTQLLFAVTHIGDVLDEILREVREVSP